VVARAVHPLAVSADLGALWRLLSCFQLGFAGRPLWLLLPHRACCLFGAFTCSVVWRPTNPAVNLPFGLRVVLGLVPRTRRPDFASFRNHLRLCWLNEGLVCLLGFILSKILPKMFREKVQDLGRT